MKYIIQFFALLCVFGISYLGVFAEEDIIDVSLSSSDIQMGESLQMRIQVDTQTLKNNQITIDIPGQENFSIFSQGQSTSFKSINGNTTSQSVFSLDMRPLKSGEFTLGPVTISSGTGVIIDDVVMTIKVEDILSTVIPTSINPQDENNNIQDREENQIKEDHDIKKPFLLLFSLLGIFIIIFYLLLQLFFRKNNIERGNSQEISIEEKGDFFQKMIKYFEALGVKSQNISSQKFFQLYNEGLRQVFIHEGIKNAHSMTLMQFKKDSFFLRHVLGNIFIKSYEYEYVERNTRNDTRKKYIKTITTYLKDKGNISL